jgi:RNA polymerase primary sigma factor
MSIGDSGGMTLAGLIRDDSESDPETVVLDKEVLDELHQILSELNDREQRVMRMRFQVGEPDTSSPDPEEVAKELKLSRERVRQIEVQAIKKLRAIAQKRRSKDVLGN